MTSETVDLVILGGGCAGLSLATRLAAANASNLKTLVLENRTSYENDRAWCFFKDSAEPGRPDIQHTWPAMRIASSQASVVLDCNSAPYQMVHAGRFYEQAQAALNLSVLTELRLGVNVAEPPTKRDGLWQINAGATTIYTRFVVDTRPARFPARGGVNLWQSFYGQEIECSADIFDTSCGDLMDFSSPRAFAGIAGFKNAVCFVYVLPTTARRALIEFTVFGSDRLGPEQLRDMLALAIAQRTGAAGFEVLRSEHGVLPMGITPIATATKSDPTYVFAGLTAGGARPSSGYAFSRIQSWSADCAESLAAGRQPMGHQRDSLVLRTMDALFLMLVRAYPQAAPDLFVALFCSTKPQSVIRFLSDRASLADYVRVVAALFPGPLLRALLGRRLSCNQAAELLKVQ